MPTTAQIDQHLKEASLTYLKYMTSEERLISMQESDNQIMKEIKVINKLM